VIRLKDSELHNDVGIHWPLVYVLDLERRDEGSWWGAEMGAELADMN
jgi:hypothetical protein